MSGMGHSNLLSTVIPPQIKIYNLGTGYQGIPILEIYIYIQAIIPRRKSQSRHTHHSPSMLIPYSTTAPPEKVEELGPTTSPFLAHTGPPPLYKYSPMGHL